MSQEPPRGSTDAAHAADADPGAPRRAAEVVAAATARAVAKHVATRAAEAMAREVVARVLRDTLEPAVRTQVDRGVRTVARTARHTAERVTAEAHEGFRREIDHVVWRPCGAFLADAYSVPAGGARRKILLWHRSGAVVHHQTLS